MKFIPKFLIAITIGLCFHGAMGQAPGGWMRVQSDDGEFSIEVPTQYKFFLNKDGFSVSEIGASINYRLQNMYMLNAYTNGSMVSFESYEAKKGALEAIFKSDVYKKDALDKSSIKKLGFSIRQTIQRTDSVYAVRQYFFSKNHIYILTAASRSGETSEIRRFLDSLRLKINPSSVTDTDGLSFSKLHVSDVAIELKLDKGDNDARQKSTNPIQPKDDDKTIKKLVIFNKQRPSYVDLARQKNVMGIIQVRVTFSEDGFIPKIVVLRALPEGLLQQSLFATIRLKFMPQEKDNKPESVEKTLEYSFDIY